MLCREQGVQEPVCLSETIMADMVRLAARSLQQTIDSGWQNKARCRTTWIAKVLGTLACVQPAILSGVESLQRQAVSNPCVCRQR